MRHVFKATKFGWGSAQEGIWFDADLYSKESARAEFKPFSGYTQFGEYPYTAYEYDGQKYYSVTYLGLFEDNKMPTNDYEALCAILGLNTEEGE